MGKNDSMDWQYQHSTIKQRENKELEVYCLSNTIDDFTHIKSSEFIHFLCFMKYIHAIFWIKSIKTENPGKFCTRAPALSLRPWNWCRQVNGLRKIRIFTLFCRINSSSNNSSGLLWIAFVEQAVQFSLSLLLATVNLICLSIALQLWQSVSGQIKILTFINTKYGQVWQG